MSSMTKRQMDRLAEKLHRLTYELDHDVKRINTGSHPSHGEELASIVRRLGNLARAMEAEIT